MGAYNQEIGKRAQEIFKKHIELGIVESIQLEDEMPITKVQGLFGTVNNQKALIKVLGKKGPYPREGESCQGWDVHKLARLMDESKTLYKRPIFLAFISASEGLCYGRWLHTLYGEEMQKIGYPIDFNQAGRDIHLWPTYLMQTIFVLTPKEKKEFTEICMRNNSPKEQADIFLDSKPVVKSPQGINIEVGGKWDYDRSLDHAQITKGLEVLAVEQRKDSPGYNVYFKQQMPYRCYGYEYFDGTIFRPAEWEK